MNPVIWSQIEIATECQRIQEPKVNISSEIYYERLLDNATCQHENGTLPEESGLPDPGLELPESEDAGLRADPGRLIPDPGLPMAEPGLFIPERAAPVLGLWAVVGRMLALV